MEAALANQGSIIEPAYLSTSQHFENSDHMEAALAYMMPSWTYSRIANPTMGYLEETLALLEGYGVDGEVSAVMTASGMAAVFFATNPFLVLDENDGRSPINIVVSAKCYGGTYMLFSQRYGVQRGIEVRWIQDTLDINAWAEKIDANTCFVFGEMPSNPGLAVFDIPAVAELAHAQDIPLIIDSTVATLALLRPLTLGADIVVQSVSKSMATSGFAIAGAVIARHDIPSRVGPDELRANFVMYIKLFPLRDYGPGLSPFSALMILKDLHTLRQRMDYISSNSMQVANFLDQHPLVETVWYPGLKSSPGHSIAARDMCLVDSADDNGMPHKRYGHLLSFTVCGGVQAARTVFDQLEMI